MAQLTADFSAVSTQGCSPFTVQFQDNSSGGPTEWFWDFGNGSTSTLQNPAVTYSTSGKYTVRLIIKNALGQAYREKPGFINILPVPDVRFSISGSSGCAPVSPDFKDNSELFGATAQSWLWTFGDGDSSTEQNPAHTYTATGKFVVSLTVETTDGCVATLTRQGAVGAGNKPMADFTGDPTSGCASAFRQFKNKTTGSITESTWSFGDGGGSSAKDPLYHYTKAGIFDVRLIVSDNGCKDTAFRLAYMEVQAPIARIGTVVNCDDRFSVSFKDRSTGGIKRFWDFGDGQTSTAQSIVHTYAAPGIYITSLAITGNVCSDTAYDTLYIKTGSPKVNVLPAAGSYCKYDSLKIFVTGYDSVFSRFFGWDFDDGATLGFSSKGDSAMHAYSTNGLYKPAVLIKDYAGCIDTIPVINPLIISGPVAAFDSIDTGCIGAGVIFNNTSKEGNNVPVSQWLWSYGDGFFETVQQPAAHAYPFPEVFNVSLKATDANGCADSTMHSIEIFTVPVVSAGADTLVCAGSPVILQPSGALTYVWQSDPDLSCTNCVNPVATPFKPTVYYVTGTTGGCSASDSVIINVQAKDLVTVQPDAYTICQGNTVTLNASGTDTYSWSPPNSLNNSTIPNPVASPASSTVYTVIGKDMHNCFADTAQVSVMVNPPPTVNIMDSAVELFTGTTYTILTTASGDVQKLEWTPATGLSCYDCLQPLVTATNNVTYTVKATNVSGCASEDSITINTVCTDKFVYIPNTFSPNNDGMNDYFFPRSGAGITIKSLTIFNRWGQMVFQKKDFPANNSGAGWDGKYKNTPQSADAYVYMMELTCSGNKVFVKKGTITLLR